MMSVRERPTTHNVSLTHDTCSPTVVAPVLNVHLNRQVYVYSKLSIVTPLSTMGYTSVAKSVDFTFEVEANVTGCVHSSVNKPGVKRNSGL